MILRFLFLLLLAVTAGASAFAEEPKPDDSVTFDLSSEDWVATKTAHVTVTVEAAVNAANAGGMRADMTKAVNDAAKGDWRLTGFTRAQDQTGMERWSVTFEARLPEGALNGLSDAVKKASKPGMQITVGDIDFSPTLDETEATKAVLRAHILKDANDQLAVLNAALPGRAYRIAQISFESETPPQPRAMHHSLIMSAAAMAPAPEAAQDHVQKMVLIAHVTYAALPPAAANKP